VMVSLSKGLGCPVGSLLAGTRAHMDAARPVRRRLGGALRQSGILAAAGIYAIENNRARLQEDHENAQLLAARIGIGKPESNIVMIDVPNAADVVSKLKEQGVLMVEYAPTRVRAITHLDVTRADVERAAEALAKVLA
jgi:threonine aldolase